MLIRITSNDNDLVMPPPETGKSVSVQELRLLRLWIEQQAPYADHWAFQSPAKTPVPEVSKHPLAQKSNRPLRARQVGSPFA